MPLVLTMCEWACIVAFKLCFGYTVSFSYLKYRIECYVNFMSCSNRGAPFYIIDYLLTYLLTYLLCVSDIGGLSCHF